MNGLHSVMMMIHGIQKYHNVAQSINDTSNSADIILGIPSNAYHYLMTVFPSPYFKRFIFYWNDSSGRLSILQTMSC